MSDLQILYLVVAVLYVWECACWLSRSGLAFRTWWNRRWSLIHPSIILGNAKGGFVFAHPFPPLGTVFAAGQLPVSLSPQAVLGFVATSVGPGARPAQSGRCVPWEQVEGIEIRGKKVLLNTELLFKAQSVHQAEYIGKLLKDLKQTEPGQREALIRQEFRTAFDTSRIEQLCRDFANESGMLQNVTNGLFGYVFLMIPAAIWRFGLPSSWPFLLAGVFGLTGTIAILFHRIHKKLFPAAEDERFTHSLIFFLSPATAIRARDTLSRPFLEPFHPLAIAKILCRREQLEQLARRYMRELYFPQLPLCPANDPLGAETEQFSRQLLRREVERFLERGDLKPERLLEDPLPSDATCLAYCPRCLAQFTVTSGQCADCGGVPLKPFTREPNPAPCTA